MTTVVFTADDFGLDPAVNEAVERAFRQGVLTTADLMMGQPGTEDALRRLERLPGLAVGLHLALTRATALLAGQSSWAGRDGKMPENLVESALRVCLPRLREAARRELEAQFSAFQRTGLDLDHVSVHQHFHLHPVVRDLIFDVGQAYGMAALRVPYEPWYILRRAGMAPRWGEYLASWPWVDGLAREVRRRGLGRTAFVWGNAATGHLTPARLRRLLTVLPPGIHEIYCHPATTVTALLHRQAPDYERVAELAALTDPDTLELVDRLGIRRATYRTL
jgi:hopanoid biosynthesis associated protein HpnK